VPAPERKDRQSAPREHQGKAEIKNGDRPRQPCHPLGGDGTERLMFSHSFLAARAGVLDRQRKGCIAESPLQKTESL
jgi:hypothetical protein